jgi:OPA family sugar phosphate sensor protein UhpC-like MFS transporter
MKTKNTAKTGSIFLICYIAYTCIYIARLNLSMASPAMRDAGLLTATQLGFIGSAFSVVYSCGRLFNGILVDRMAPKLLVVAGLVLTAAANLLIGILPPYILVLTLWCLNAFGQSMLWSAMLRIMTGVYGKDTADRKVPILVSSVSVGNILGILFSSQLVSWFGIRAAFLVPGGMTAAMGLLVLWIIPHTGVAASGAKKPFPFRELLQNKQIRGVLLPSMFHGAMKDTISLFMAVYFLDTFLVDLESSSWYVLLIPVVGLLGRLIYPTCYRLLKRREHLLSVICFAACAVFAGILCFPLESPLVAAIALSMIYALVSMINTSILSMFPLRFAEMDLVGSVSGITDFATYLGAAIASAIYGLLIETGGYFYMFASWVVLSILSILLLLRLKPMQKGT